MERTALTVGGFTQPTVAKSLIELPASVEKGLTQRFLWIFPKPSFGKFNTLELVDERFSLYLGEHTVCPIIISLHAYNTSGGPHSIIICCKTLKATAMQYHNCLHSVGYDS